MLFAALREETRARHAQVPQRRLHALARTARKQIFPSRAKSSSREIAVKRDIRRSRRRFGGTARERRRAGRGWTLIRSRIKNSVALGARPFRRGILANPCWRGQAGNDGHVCPCSAERAVKLSEERIAGYEVMALRALQLLITAPRSIFRLTTLADAGALYRLAAAIMRDAITLAVTVKSSDSSIPRARDPRAPRVAD